MGLNEILERSKSKIANENDDIRVLRSLTEWEPDGQTLKHLIYEMEMMDRNGDIKRFYKVIKLLRVIRVPKSMKQTLSFPHIHTEVMTGVWENGINLITIICNMITPPLGLLFLYGVQAVDEDLNVARNKTDKAFAGLSSMLQGSYKTLHYRVINFEEAEWLREKMFAMKHLSVIRGIPKIREGGTTPSSNSKEKGGGNKVTNQGGQNTNEEFILGMSDREYIVLCLASPVSTKAIHSWLTKVAKEMTIWNSQQKGTKSLNASFSLPFMFVGGVTSNQGWNQGVNDSHTVSHSDQISHGESFSESVGKSDGVNQSHSVGHSDSVGESQNLTHSEGTGKTVTDGTTEGSSYNVSEGYNTSTNHSQGTNDSVALSDSHSKSTTSSESNGLTNTEGVTNSTTQGQTAGVSHGRSDSYSQGSSDSHGNSTNVSGTVSFGGGLSPVSGSVSGGKSWSDTHTTSETATHGTSEQLSQSVSNTTGTSDSHSNAYSNTKTAGLSEGDTTGKSVSTGKNESWGESYGENFSKSSGINLGRTNSVAQSESNSDSLSKGINSSESVTENKALGTSSSITQSVSKGLTETKGESDSTGRSFGTSQGTSGGLSQILNTSMGSAFSVGASKSFQWEDQEVTNIVEMLKYLNTRLMTASNGNGLFYTDMYIATPDDETKAAANAVAKTAWHNGSALVNPMTIMDLPPDEESHLLYHFQAFSPDSYIEGTPGDMGSYKYTSLLLPEEQAAYTHPPRISEGGIYADVEDIPQFSVPSMKKGEIYLGKVISSERWTAKWGYETPFSYYLSLKERMHGIATAQSQTGKTTLMTRYVAEKADKIIPETNKRMRIVAMDAKQDWRILGKFVAPERFNFWSLGNPDLLPINLNIWKIPKNVNPQHWIDGMIEVYCRQYGMGELGKSAMSENAYYLYEKAGVFDENCKDLISERSAAVTFPKIFERIQYRRTLLNEEKASFDVKSIYDKLVQRLQPFSRKFSIEYKMFGRDDGMGIDELIGEDDVTVLESYGLETTFKNFIFGAITSGFFKIAQSCEGGFKSADQYETELIIEEANEVLTGQDTQTGDKQSMKGQSEFEKILDQSAGLGLYIFSITQKISSMPASVIANSGTVFAGKISRKEDVEVLLRKLGKEEKRADLEYVKWFPKSPVGWFVVNSTKNYDIKDSEPVLIKVAPLNVKAPTNEELKQMAIEKEAIKKSKMN